MKYENLVILIDITDANNVLLSLFPYLLEQTGIQEFGLYDTVLV